MSRERDSAQWNPELYARYSSHHREHDASFLATVKLAPTAHVLDLGCGTGEFTNRLAELVPQGLVLGVDASPSQIEHARAIRRPEVELRLGHLQQLDALLGNQLFDAVISRATLHWVPEADHPALLRAAFTHLRPHGFMRAEFGGRGQIRPVMALLDSVSSSLGGPVSPWFYPDVAQYQRLITQAGFVLERGFVRLVNQTRSMPTLEALLGFLRSQAFLGYEMGLSPEAQPIFRERAEARAQAELLRPNGFYDLDFVRLDWLAWKP